VHYYTQYGNQTYDERGGWLAWSRRFTGRVANVQMGADYRQLSAQDDERFYSPPVSLASLQNLNSAAYGEGSSFPQHPSKSR